VMQDSNVWEKAGVNISVVNGTLPAAAAEQMRVRSGIYLLCQRSTEKTAKIYVLVHCDMRHRKSFSWFCEF